MAPELHGGDNNLGETAGPQNAGGRAIGHVLALGQAATEIYVGSQAAAAGGTEAFITSPAVVTVAGAAAPAVGVAVVVGGGLTATHGVVVAARTLNNIFFGKANKAGHPDRTDSVEGAQDNLEDLESNQSAARKHGDGDATIQSTEGSKSKLNTQLKKIKTSEIFSFQLNL